MKDLIKEALSASLLALAGCSTDVVAGEYGPGPGGVGPGDSTGDGNASDDGGDDGDGDGDGDGSGGGDDGAGDDIRYDVGPGEGGPGDEQDGCKKIDFLFVIDNSASMASHQEHLIEAFPGFIDSIRTTVAGQDHHMMVVDSDEDATWMCEYTAPPLTNLCQSSGSRCDDYPCGWSDSLPACDKALGAGVSRAYGENTEDRECGFPDGRRYLTERDPDLETLFACAARVGTSGSWYERSFSALAQSLSPQGESAACNEGFLRDDAILVITIVTDDYIQDDMWDDSREFSAEPWYQAVVDAKNGDPNAVVVIGFIHRPDGADACTVYGGDVPVFDQFMNKWPNAVVANVCEGSYASIFDSAVSVIETACDEFVPQG